MGSVIMNILKIPAMVHGGVNAQLIIMIMIIITELYHCKYAQFPWNRETFQYISALQFPKRTWKTDHGHSFCSFTRKPNKTKPELPALPTTDNTTDRYTVFAMSFITG